MSFKADLPDDIEQFLQNNFKMENIDEKLDENHIITCFDSFS
jgi:23S rRNA pseudouridine1911/1915/1917 synthase